MKRALNTEMYGMRESLKWDRIVPAAGNLEERDDSIGLSLICSPYVKSRGPTRNVNSSFPLAGQWTSEPANSGRCLCSLILLLWLNI